MQLLVFRGCVRFWCVYCYKLWPSAGKFEKVAFIPEMVPHEVNLSTYHLECQALL